MGLDLYCCVGDIPEVGDRPIGTAPLGTAPPANDNDDVIVVVVRVVVVVVVEARVEAEEGGGDAAKAADKSDVVLGGVDEIKLSFDATKNCWCCCWPLLLLVVAVKEAMVVVVVMPVEVGVELLPFARNSLKLPEGLGRGDGATFLNSSLLGLIRILDGGTGGFLSEGLVDQPTI